MSTNFQPTTKRSGTPNDTVDASLDVAQPPDPSMSFKIRSQDRTTQLAKAVENYHERATAERLFDLSGITTISELHRLRDDPQVNEDLAQLDAEIQQVQALQRQLSTVQAKLGVWRARSRNLLCPIYMLPNELLGQIFTCSLPEGRELVEFTTAVSCVCRLWRDVAIRYRSMWRVFDLRWHAAREQAWMTRSMDPKLSVYADFPGPQGEDHLLSAADYRGLFRQDGIFEHSHSWVSAEFSISSSSHLAPVMGYISPQCSGLQSLIIMDGASNDSIDDYQIIEADLWPLTSDMPKLTELTLRSVYPISLYDLIPRLRILRINTIGWRSSAAGSVRRWMDLMRQATSLEELEADWDRMGWRRHRVTDLMNVTLALDIQDDYKVPVDMTKLKRLKINCIDVRVSSHLFQHFRCPALESLSIELSKVTFTSRGCNYGDLDRSLNTFFKYMPSLETAIFKAHLETLSLVLSAMKGRRLQPQETGAPAGITHPLPLLTLRSLTLCTFPGLLVEGKYLSEPSDGMQKWLRRGFRNVPWSLQTVCARRAEARDPTLVPETPASLDSNSEKLRTFDLLALRGIHCPKIDRSSLRKYTTVLSLDDPFDPEDTESEDSDASSEEDLDEEPWRGSQVSADGPDEKWHSSDQSFTDEEMIDQESEESVVGGNDAADDSSDSEDSDMDAPLWAFPDGPGDDDSVLPSSSEESP